MPVGAEAAFCLGEVLPFELLPFDRGEVNCALGRVVPFDEGDAMSLLIKVVSFGIGTSSLAMSSFWKVLMNLRFQGDVWEDFAQTLLLAVEAAVLACDPAAHPKHRVLCIALGTADDCMM